MQYGRKLIFGGFGIAYVTGLSELVLRTCEKGQKKINEGEMNEIPD
jgi:hypothetical protein